MISSGRHKPSELRIAKKLAPTVLLDYLALGIASLVLVRVRELSG